MFTVTVNPFKVGNVLMACKPILTHNDRCVIRAGDRVTVVRTTSGTCVVLTEDGKRYNVCHDNFKLA